MMGLVHVALLAAPRHATTAADRRRKTRKGEGRGLQVVAVIRNPDPAWCW